MRSVLALDAVGMGGRAEDEEYCQGHRLTPGLIPLLEHFCEYGTRIACLSNRRGQLVGAIAPSLRPRPVYRDLGCQWRRRRTQPDRAIYDALRARRDASRCDASKVWRGSRFVGEPHGPVRGWAVLEPLLPNGEDEKPLVRSG
jgi:hypothetical protein